MISKETLSCISCGAEARKALSVSQVAFKADLQKVGVQNTGTTSLDYSHDRVIGQQSWSTLHEMQKRQDYKRTVIESEMTDGHHLSRDPTDGSYWVMDDAELLAAKKGREIQKVLSRAVRDYERRKQF